LRFFGALGDALLVLVGWVIWLAPVGVFALMLPLGAHGGAGLAGAVGFYIAAYSVGCVLFTLLLYPALAVFARLPMRRFARPRCPAQLIAFFVEFIDRVTARAGARSRRRSQTAQGRHGFRVAAGDLDLQIRRAGVVDVRSLFVAWYYHVNLGPTDYLTIACAAVFLAFAAPGVPRGAFLMLTPLFLSIGLPPEGIGILIAVDAIPDLFATVLNATGDLAAAVFVARRSA
jgi:Na+/H+-dicarboxylate symporter